MQVQSPERSLQQQVLTTLRNAVYLTREQARWQVSSAQIVRAIFADPSRNLSLVTQRDGREVCVQNLEGGSQCQALPEGVELLTAAKFSPDGQKVAWAEDRNPQEPDVSEIHIWDWENQRFYQRSTATSHSSHQFEFGLDSQSLIFIQNTQGSRIKKGVRNN